MGLRKTLYRGLMQLKLVRPKVLVAIDGGVCSQMHQHLLGYLFTKKGYSVRYDFAFFDEGRRDLHGRFERNFDLLKAFPYLHLPRASEIAVRVYKRKYYYNGNNSGERTEDFSFLQFTPPVYLGGYYHLPPGLWLDAFRTLYKLVPGVLDAANKEVSDEIAARACPVGVHVRRGDLVDVVYAYGKPASSDYFRKAVLYFKENTLSPYFYFFSDEPEWVREELISRLAVADDYKIIDINGSDKGYMDLYLMAYCKHQITSKGTLGKYAALLNDNPRKIVTLCDDTTEYSWKDLLCNPLYL